MSNINENIITDTKDKSNYSLKELMIIEAVKKLNNPFVNLTVQDVAKDLKIGENMAYTIFERDDFPSVNIRKMLENISYIISFMENSKKGLKRYG